MTIWLEFPPSRLTAIRSAYLNAGVKDGETIQHSPLVDATGTRMLVGSSRLASDKAVGLAQGNVPWLIVHPAHPKDWQYPKDDA